MAVTITVAIGTMKRAATFEDEERATAVLLAYSELQGVDPAAQPGVNSRRWSMESSTMFGKMQERLDGSRRWRRQSPLRKSRRLISRQLSSAYKKALSADGARWDTRNGTSARGGTGVWVLWNCGRWRGIWRQGCGR